MSGWSYQWILEQAKSEVVILILIYTAPQLNMILARLKTL